MSLQAKLVLRALIFRTQKTQIVMRFLPFTLSAASILFSALLAPGCSDDFEPDPTGTTSSSSGTAGGTPAGCVPADEAAPVDDKCGVFVSASKGNDGDADGSKAKPYATIGAALATNTNNIYLCGEKLTAETISVAAGKSLYGALSCATDWSYDAAKKSELTGLANSPAVTVSGDGKTNLADLAITAPAATDPGASSIALLASAATVDIVRTDLTAGAGAPGADGASTPADIALDGVKGEDGTNQPTGACETQSHTGGKGGTKSCGGTAADGGAGGVAFTDPGGKGKEGQPTTMDTTGDGGPGQVAGGADCVTGKQGAKGENGALGTGASGLGTLSASGYAGVDGAAGEPGAPGQGGGGGGASACTNGNTGPSGGGGGSGGCGGQAGGAGLAAGASIALVSLNATVTITNSQLTTSTGGKGGNGGNGQPGGAGADGGAKGGNFACPGGLGGNGGKGGPGGGGLGGHSVGIAYTGTAPTEDSVSLTIDWLRRPRRRWRRWRSNEQWRRRRRRRATELRVALLVPQLANPGSSCAVAPSPNQDGQSFE